MENQKSNETIPSTAILIARRIQEGISDSGITENLCEWYKDAVSEEIYRHSIYTVAHKNKAREKVLVKITGCTRSEVIVKEDEADYKDWLEWNPDAVVMEENND